MKKQAITQRFLSQKCSPSNKKWQELMTVNFVCFRSHEMEHKFQKQLFSESERQTCIYEVVNQGAFHETRIFWKARLANPLFSRLQDRWRNFDNVPVLNCVFSQTVKEYATRVYSLLAQTSRIQWKCKRWMAILVQWQDLCITALQERKILMFLGTVKWQLVFLYAKIIDF